MHSATHKFCTSCPSSGNQMQLETEDFASGAATWQSQPINAVCHPTGATTSGTEWLYEMYASSFILAYPCIVGKRGVIHKTGSRYFMYIRYFIAITGGMSHGHR